MNSSSTSLSLSRRVVNHNRSYRDQGQCSRSPPKPDPAIPPFCSWHCTEEEQLLSSRSPDNYFSRLALGRCRQRFLVLRQSNALIILRVSKTSLRFFLRLIA